MIRDKIKFSLGIRKLTMLDFVLMNRIRNGIIKGAVSKPRLTAQHLAAIPYAV